jgi:uncharacterized FAD-dependent dehydrogenase
VNTYINCDFYCCTSCQYLTALRCSKRLRSHVVTAAANAPATTATATATAATNVAATNVTATATATAALLIGEVRAVLEALVQHGAPDRILVDGKPHLGTDRLVRILRDMRAALQERGATFMFGTRVEDVLIHNGKV